MNYRDYLRSGAWKDLARQARYRAGNRCELCGDTPDHVHHIDYPKNFKDDSLGNLLVLCASCHAKSHGIRGEEMTAVKAITVSGFKICTTSGDGGIPLVRFKDVMLAFGHRENMIDKALWRRVANTIIEGVHWVRMENPFTLKQDLFLTISGTGVIAATECRNHEVAREIVHQMAASWEREMIGSRKVRSDIATTDDHEMVFLQGLLDSVGAARREAKQAHIEATQARIESQEALSAAHRSEASSQSVLEAIEKVERDVRDYITARKFCRDEGIPAGKADKNIKELGARASRICRSEGIKFLFHARTDGDFAANAYPSWVLARAAREIGLIH